MRNPATRAKPAAPESSASVKVLPQFPAWLQAVLLGLATIALYWPATNHDFVNYDDDVYVTANAHVQEGLTLENVVWAFTHPVNANWHPLTVLSHMLDCQLFGLDPRGHHFTSVLLHAVNTVLVFVLLRGLTGADWRSLLVAALFGWHPAHVESAAWVAERKDVLSTCFGLLALLFYARYAAQLTNDNKKSKTCYWAALFFFACGLMSKAMLVTWPLVMLMLDYWPLGRWKASSLRQLVWEKMPFFALTALASGVTYVVQKDQGALAVGEKLPLAARGGNALVSYCRYLGKIFWPTNLAVFYPHPGYWPLWEVLAAGALLACLSALFWWQRRQYPFLLMGWLWFLVTLLPVIQLVQTGSHSMADRYTYIPSLGVFILVVGGADELTKSWRYRVPGLPVVALAAMVLCLALTWRQLGYWQDSETLFRHELAVAGDNDLAHNNLGDALERQGRIAEAKIEFQEAVRLKPDSADARFNLGKVLLDEGQVDEAISRFQEAIGLKPDFARARNNLGVAFDAKGRIDEAMSEYREAIRLEPDYAEPHSNLAAVLGKKGQIDEAINQCQEAIRLNPNYAEAHSNLGIAFYAKGRMDEAISQFQEAVRLKPDYAVARNNLARVLQIKNASPNR